MAKQDVRACALCGNRRYKLYWRKKECDIGRCVECGLVQVIQDVSDDTLRSIYDELYYTGGTEDGYRDYLANLDAKKQYFEELWDKFCHTNGIERPGKCLEIGCAYGLFLVAARNRGWTVRGIEISSHAAEYARREFGLRVNDNPDSFDEIMDNSQDVVVMWDVIEHLKCPKSILDRAYRVLAPSGVLALSTGNLGSLGAWLYGEKWFLIAPPKHMIYFDNRTISNMLISAGFRIRNIVNGGGHPLENGDRTSRLVRWICAHDKWVGWRLNSGPVMTVTAIKT